MGAEDSAKHKKNHPPTGGWSFKPKSTAYETKIL